MIVTASRLRQLGWSVVFAAALFFFIVLSVRVHAIKNEVVLAERQIVALKKHNQLLETEFQSRANQRQLANWNRVEFGYEAPRADQYLEKTRALAAFGAPAGPGSPSPIRVARAEFAAGDAVRANDGAALQLASAQDNDAQRVAASSSESPVGDVAAQRAKKLAMVSPITQRKVGTQASANPAGGSGDGPMFVEAFSDFLMDASPIRPANAASLLPKSRTSSAGSMGQDGSE